MIGKRRSPSSTVSSNYCCLCNNFEPELFPLPCGHLSCAYCDHTTPCIRCDHDLSLFAANNIHSTAQSRSDYNLMSSSSAPAFLDNHFDSGGNETDYLNSKNKSAKPAHTRKQKAGATATDSVSHAFVPRHKLVVLRPSADTTTVPHSSLLPLSDTSLKAVVGIDTAAAADSLSAAAWEGDSESASGSADSGRDYEKVERYQWEQERQRYSRDPPVPEPVAVRRGGPKKARIEDGEAGVGTSSSGREGIIVGKKIKDKVTAAAVPRERRDEQAHAQEELDESLDASERTETVELLRTTLQRCLDWAQYHHTARLPAVASRTATAFQTASPFLEGINPAWMPEYYRVVGAPMDLAKMRMRAAGEKYLPRGNKPGPRTCSAVGHTLAQAVLGFVGDLQLIHDNALLYNTDQRGDTYVRAMAELFLPFARAVVHGEVSLFMTRIHPAVAYFMREDTRLAEFLDRRIAAPVRKYIRSNSIVFGCSFSAAAQYKVGEVVEVQYGGGVYFYAATVTRTTQVKRDSFYCVKFREGSTDRNVRPERMRRRGVAFAPPGSE